MVQESKRSLDSKINSHWAICGFVSLVLFFFPSCKTNQRISSVEKSLRIPSNLDFDLNSLTEERKLLLQRKKIKQLELHRLKLRVLIVQSQLLANQAQSSRNALAHEMAKFVDFEARFPHPDGFISSNEWAAYQGRLEKRDEEVELANARVRLLLRDLKKFHDETNKEGLTIQDRPKFDLSPNQMEN